jgi:hypothetical protein
MLRSFLFSFIILMSFISFNSLATDLATDFSTICSTELSSEPRSVMGRWRHVGLIYDGTRMPPRDARLDLRYELYESQISRLAWTYDNWRTLCERFAYFEINSNQIVDEVIWVNPENRDECSLDPDMQLGKKSITPFLFEGENLLLEIPFGADSIYYEWERVF